ncbi:MAG TPA: LuxR C-terminal-related transcriptional regulator [Pyrinomonadaceae bacterium]|jgi:DNA-binding CsgD family transcriptional regulator
MFPFNKQISGVAHSDTYPLGENLEHNSSQQLMALVALSHTVIEHRLYSAMLAEMLAAGTRVGSFSTRRLMTLTGISGYSTIRRGLHGLLNKLSIERQKVAGEDGTHHPGTVYLIFSPEEILARRRSAGLPAYPKEVQAHEGSISFGRAIQRVVGVNNLSRREAQVALCCADGLTNAQIGTKLRVSEQTIKFHLRNIFIKFGVKRRTELVSRLLTQDGAEAMKEKAGAMHGG